MKKIHEKLKQVLGQKVLTKILYVLGILIGVIIIFNTGMVVGFHRASFGRAWGEHYRENFGIGERENMMMGIPNPGVMGFFPNAHGAIGKILKIEPSSIIVEDNDGTEKIILINDKTSMEKIRESIKITDLVVDDTVVVIGSPNSQGQIEAKFIRVLPFPKLIDNDETNETTPN